MTSTGTSGAAGGDASEMEPIRLGKVVDSPAADSSSSDSTDSSSGSDGEDDAASVSTAETVDQKSKVCVFQV